MEKTLLTENVREVSPIFILRLLIPILGFAGISISGYLTYIHYLQIEALCLPNMNCNSVLTSQYAQIWGIPLSLLGMLLYAAITTLGFSNLLVRQEPREIVSLGIYAFSLAGILFTLYLYYLEIFELHAFCSWCVSSSIIMVGIFCLALGNLSNLGMPLKQIPRLLLRWVSRYIQW
jgi:uncharacterized membrane protein